jgi:hypothetical protein
MGGSAMVDRLRLLVAVNMVAPPTTTGVAKRLAVSRDEAESALHDAECGHLVAKQRLKRMLRSTAVRDLTLWRLSDEGRAEMNRLLHPN